MAQLSPDSLAFGGSLMRLAELAAFVESRIAPVEDRELVPLAGALGRIAAADHRSLTSIPAFDNSAVDGYAVRFTDLAEGTDTRMPVSGYVTAGASAAGIAPGTAIRIFTGAPMPAGADTVFMQEDCRVDGDHVVLPPGLERGSNRRLAGEDVAEGAVIIAKGLRLRPQDMGLAAASGLARLDVVRRIRVALFSTGSEVFEPGTPLPPSGLYDANRPLLVACLQMLGVEVSDLGILPDEPHALRNDLARAACGHDLVLTSGGVSTGEADHVKDAVEAAGRLDLWRLAIKPGRPVAMGVLPDGKGRWTPFAGLPGNPVAAFITFAFVIKPVLQRLAGAPITLPGSLPIVSDFKYRKKEGRREYVRVTLFHDPEGRVLARKFPRDGAGVITSLTETHGLVELPEEVRALSPGDVVRFISYDGLLT